MLGQEISDEQGTATTDYIINYLPKFEKDAKYYANKNIKFEQKIYDLLNLYKKFLVENKHFVNTKTSDDLVVPVDIKNPNYDEYLDVIEKVVDSGNFDLLRNHLDLLLDSAV